jgi:sterol desaturase/sphingolipid hydroxylase (fatty acid hydroxylase superfamily)
VGDVGHAGVVSAGPGWRTPLLNDKVAYYTDFGVYGMLVVALLVFTLPVSRSDQLIWLVAAIAGTAGWTLIEYLLHRFVLHHSPYLSGNFGVTSAVWDYLFGTHI